MNRRRSATLIFLCITALLSGCLNDSAEPTLDLNGTPLPGTAISAPTSTPQPAFTPAPTVAPWLESLLEPGPPALVSPALFFQNGPDAWFVGSDLSVQQVTEQRRVATVETVPGSISAAILLVDAVGGRETEEIRIVDADGNESEPIYGPEIVSDPGGNPRVRLIRWSPDGQRLAIVRDDDSIWLSGPESSAEELELDQPLRDIEAIRWSPTGEALAILHRSGDNAGALRIIPVDASGSFDVPPLGSFGALCWPAGRGRLIVSEDDGVGQNPNAGSLFSISANGAGRELLISAGEFGPVIRIGALLSSPDGAQLAFTVETPGSNGGFQFQSLYIRDLTSGIQSRLEVSPGFAVSDLWWFERGLIWRAVESENGSSYSGVEPFVIESADLGSGETRLLFTSDGT